MKTLFRALVILLAGIALGLAFLPLGTTSWAENQRNRRGRGRPPGASLERPASPPGADGTAAAANGGGENFRGGRGQPGAPGGRGGRGGPGGEQGLFGHFRGKQSFTGDALRFTQIIVIQLGVPAGLTLALLAYARRGRKSSVSA
jgi:hypothetical protein